MTAPERSRSSRMQEGLDSWFSTVVPWVGMGGAVACLVTHTPEGIVPFTGLAALPSVVNAQRKRNRGRK